MISWKVCSVEGCYNSNKLSKDKIHFFSFPRCPRTHQEWIKFCKDDSLNRLSQSSLLHRYICALHFNTKYFRTPEHDSLVRGAVPTIYLPNNLLTQNIFSAQNVSRPRLTTGSTRTSCSSPVNDSYRSVPPLLFVECDKVSSCEDISVDSIKEELSTISKAHTKSIEVSKHCCVLDCDSSSDNVCDDKFYPLPDRDTDVARHEKWIDFAKNPLLDNQAVTVGTHFMCGLHFEDSQFLSLEKIRLKPDACPSIKPPVVPTGTEPITGHEIKSEITTNKKDSTTPEVEVPVIIPNVVTVLEEDVLDCWLDNEDLQIINDGDDHIDRQLDEDQINKENQEPSIDQSDSNSLVLQNVNNSSENTKINISSLSVNKKHKKYKFIVTVVKEIDERKCIKKLKHVIIKKVRQLINRLIFEAPLGKNSVSKNLEATKDGQVRSVVRVNINDGKSIAHNSNIDNSEALKEIMSNRIQSKGGLKLKDRQMKRYYSRKQKDDASNLCSECGLMFMSEYRFDHHIKLCHTEQVCAHCTETFTNLVELRQHLKVVKRNEIRRRQQKMAIDKLRRFYCPECDINCHSNSKLLRHRLKMHNIGKYETCNLCSKKFIYRSNLLIHKKDVHLMGNTSKGNICKHCGKRFHSRSVLWTHVSNMHRKKDVVQCPICKEETKDGKDYRVHITKHMNGANREEHDIASKLVNTFKNSLQCLVCRLKFDEDEEDKLKEHLAIHDNDPHVEKLKAELIDESNGKLVCRICNKRFGKEKVLAMHRLLIHKETPFICKVENCDAVYWTNLALVIHRKSIHMPHDYSCKLCGENFIDYKKKMEHMKTRHPGKQDKPFPCEHCDRRFTAPVFLKMHMISHRTKKEFKCKICGKECGTKGAYQIHVRSHDKINEVKVHKPPKPKGRHRTKKLDDVAQVEVVEETVITEWIDQVMFVDENVVSENYVNAENLKREIVINDGIVTETEYTN